MAITLPASPNVVPRISDKKKKRRVPKPSFAPSVHVADDLPCVADKDLDEIPQPIYTHDDISCVQKLLLHFVPTELADAIIDLAEYWPWVAVSRNSFTSAYSALEAPDRNAQWCYLVSPKIPSIERAGVCLPTTVKMVKFYVKTYESVYGKVITAEPTEPSQGYKTWFESMILKNGDPSTVSYDNSVRPNDWYADMAAPHPKYLNDFRDPPFIGEPVQNPFDEKKRWHIANSPDSYSDTDWHQVVWKNEDGNQVVDCGPEAGVGKGVGFVNSLSVGDQIVVMARAMSPGWINAIFNVRMEIYYALSSSYL